MNDLSNNPYILRRRTPLSEYTLSTFLFNEIAIERETDVNEIMLAVGELLALHGFNIHLLGYKFLTMLCTRYIVKSDYDENAAIGSIAEACGTTEKFIRDSITASIRYNSALTTVAAKSLNCPIDITNLKTINGSVEIFGALFKIYYNYTVSDESLNETYAINYNRIDLKNG